MKIRSLRLIILVCFGVPMLVAFYDLFMQDVVLYDYMWLYIKMSPYTNVVGPPSPFCLCEPWL